MTEKIKERPLWDYLKETKKPIILYGMGNGADMIIDVLSALGISHSDVFASDGFVRGHFFHGKKVLTFSEIKENERSTSEYLTAAAKSADNRSQNTDPSPPMIIPAATPNILPTPRVPASANDSERLDSFFLSAPISAPPVASGCLMKKKRRKTSR